MPFPISVNRVSTQQRALAPEISTWPDQNPQLIGSRCGACGATTFPVAGLLGGNNDWDPDGPRKPLMTEAQVRKVAEAGFEIGSHGMRHVSLPGIPPAALAAEAAESRAILRAISGQDVAGFCYPFGHVDAAAVEAARAAGYSYGCGIWRTPETGVFSIPRAFVDDHDYPLHLFAKEIKHLLTWGYSWAY